jgi:hypothetical protein
MNYENILVNIILTVFWLAYILHHDAEDIEDEVGRLPTSCCINVGGARR